MFRNTDVGVFTQSLQGSEQKFVVRGRSDAAINPHSYPYVKDNCLFGSGFKHLPSAPRSSWPAQKPDPALANWDGQRQHRQEHWRGCGNGFECPDVGHDVRSDTVQRRGERKLEEETSQCGCGDLQTYAEPRGVSNCLHREPVFTRSLNDSSCWNYCRGKGTRCSHLLHMYCTHLFSSHRVHTSKGNERSEWITEISECNLPPAETSNVEQIQSRASSWGVRINPRSEIIMSVTRPG